MNIHFIDTSVFANILDIPNMNADRKLVIAEFNKLIKSKNDRLILPYLIPCILLYMMLATSLKKAYVRHYGELL